MTRQTTIKIGEKQQSIQVASRTDEQIEWLKRNGYGSTMTAIVRNAVREAWERQMLLRNTAGNP